MPHGPGAEGRICNYKEVLLLIGCYHSKRDAHGFRGFFGRTEISEANTRTEGDAEADPVYFSGVEMPGFNVLGRKLKCPPT